MDLPRQEVEKKMIGEKGRKRDEMQSLEKYMQEQAREIQIDALRR